MTSQDLEVKYAALGPIEELPGERTFRGRCCTFEQFLANGPLCAAFLRCMPSDGDLHPALAALLLATWPDDPPGFEPPEAYF